MPKVYWVLINGFKRGMPNKRNFLLVWTSMYVCIVYTYRGVFIKERLAHDA